MGNDDDCVASLRRYVANTNCVYRCLYDGINTYMWKVINSYCLSNERIFNYMPLNVGSFSSSSDLRFMGH